MKSEKYIGKIYLSQPPVSVTDVIFFLGALLSGLLFFLNPWFLISLLVFAVLLLLSRSAHVSDKEYVGLLTHVLAFNPVREAREEGYEQLFRFYQQGYLEKTTFLDFYLQDFDLGKGPVHRGDDKELRSGFYTLAHLSFTDTHCKIFVLEADIIGNKLTATRRAVHRSESPTVSTKQITYNTNKTVTVTYLNIPDCPPIPLHASSTQLDEILAFFEKKN